MSKHVNILASSPWWLEATIEDDGGHGIDVAVDRGLQGEAFTGSCEPELVFTDPPIIEAIKARLADEDLIEENGYSLVVSFGWGGGDAISLWFANLVSEEYQDATDGEDEPIGDLTPWCAEFEVPVSTQCAERLLDDIRAAVRLIVRFANQGGVPRNQHPAMFALPESYGLSLLNECGAAPLIRTADLLEVAIGVAREAGIDEVCVLANTYGEYIREESLDD